MVFFVFFFFSSRRRHTRSDRDWSSDVCSSDLRQKGNVDAALADFRKAVALDPSDAKSLAQIGDILESGGDVAGAEKAYVDALAIEPSAEVDKRLDGLRARSALARLPAEYR